MTQYNIMQQQYHITGELFPVAKENKNTSNGHTVYSG